MKLSLKPLFLIILFYQNDLFCNKNNYENLFKNISVVSHKFDQQLRQLKKIKFFVQKYAINGQLKSALLSRIQKLEQKLSWFNDFSSAIPFFKPFEDKATSIKFDVKIDFYEQLTTSINEEIKAIELAASNLLKISLDGLCPNLDLNFQTIVIANDKTSQKNNRSGLLLADKKDKLDEVFVEKTVESFCGSSAGQLAKEAYKAIKPQSCWATAEECNKKWFYLSLDHKLELQKCINESIHWHDCYQAMVEIKKYNSKLDKPSLVKRQTQLFAERDSLKERLVRCENIESLENQIKSVKIPVNTETEGQLIDVLKRLIDLRMNQIHYLNARKKMGDAFSGEIAILEQKVSQLKSVVSRK